MKLYKKYKSLFAKFSINTNLRIAHFMAQIEHESGLKPVEENLNYSAKRLLEVFPKYFISKEDANRYANNPVKIGSRVYANRMGNGAEITHEGYKYRGRGFIQMTGKENYKSLSNDTGIDYLSFPEKLLTEADALNSALWFWNKNKLNSLADKDDIVGITKKINGGTNGLAHRKELLNKYKKELGI